MSETKELRTLGVLTLTTGLVYEKGIPGVYEAAEWIMGHPVWTHELPAVQAEIQERVCAAHPTFPTTPPEDFQLLASMMLAEFGEHISMPKGDGKRTKSPDETLSRAIADGTGAAHP
jgi:hypothetical protein